MERHRSSRHHRSRSNASSLKASTEGGSVGWRTVLVAAPLVYGAGVFVGDLLLVMMLGAPLGVLVSAVGVLAACALASLGLGRLVDRLRDTEPRSLGSIASPRTPIRVGGTVLLAAFGFGLCLAVLA